MSLRVFGGNTVAQFNLSQPGRYDFGMGPYQYSACVMEAGESLSLGELRSFSVYVLAAPDGAVVRAGGVDEDLEQGDCLQAEDCPVSLKVEGGPVRLLVAGTAEPHPEVKGLTLTRHANLYRINKPWGHEIWINGQHPRYALKQIKVNAGTKTSLQYHNFKQETNVLFEGTARLHYKADPTVLNDRVTSGDTAWVELQPVCTIGVTPTVLHRLEAVTDILLYEVSTPHLDDVVRVQDDSNRPHGRIEAEHQR